MTILSKTYCQSVINGIKTLQNLEGKRIPEHLLKENAKRTGNEFDPNSYFTVLKHLSMMKDYALDYFYYYADNFQGFPCLYARAKSSDSISSMGEFNSWDVENELRDYIVADEQMESYFELVVFKLLAGQFYLYWHAEYSDTKIVIAEEDIEKIVKELYLSPRLLYLRNLGRISEEELENEFKQLPEDKVDNYKKTLGLFEKVRKSELLPQVNIIDDKHVEIRYYAFTKWGGLFLIKNKMMRTRPYKTVSFEKENVVEYKCGIIY